MPATDLASQTTTPAAQHSSATAALEGQIEIQKLALHTARTPKQRRAVLARLDALIQRKKAQR